jgi:hypothetical protein
MKSSGKFDIVVDSKAIPMTMERVGSEISTITQGASQ